MSLIQEVLSAHGLPSQLDPTALELNPWFSVMKQEGLGLTTYGLAPNRVEFCFYESMEFQAIAIQEPGNLVAMSAGMFSTICRLSAIITSKGIMPSMGRTLGPIWGPDPARSFSTVRVLLDTTAPFDWPLESAGWSTDAERSTLYFFILVTIFRFVVLHELGHIAYDHPRRRGVETHQPTTITDGIGQKILKPAEAISSQAREAAADIFAFGRLLEILDRELQVKKDLEVAQIVRRHIAPDNIGLVSHALTALYLYFRMSDRGDWQSFGLNTLSHPPAPFRLKLLCASLVENKFLGIKEADALSAIKMALISGDAIMSIALNCFPNPRWFETVNTKEFDKHFEDLSQEVPQWLRPLGGPVA